MLQLRKKELVYFNCVDCYVQQVKMKVVHCTCTDIELQKCASSGLANKHGPGNYFLYNLLDYPNLASKRQILTTSQP